jgi:hypothetical protein
MELPTYYHWVSPPLGAAYALAGQTREAVQLLEGMVAQDLALNILSQYSLTVVYVAEAHMFAGQIEEAYTRAQYALEFSRAHQERGYEAYALRLLGEIAMHHNPPEVEQAAIHYHQALALAELSTAIEMYEAMEMTFWLPQAEAALVQVG